MVATGFTLSDFPAAFVASIPETQSVVSVAEHNPYVATYAKKFDFAQTGSFMLVQ